jgi:2-oxoglutarate ferredoxin oxidoreductase subunit beta
MGVEPWRVAKFSGIGCSSKSPAYFLGLSHGFNSVHGRMPAIATGAMLANRNLLGIGVTGDGDTASIGIGQFMHLVRRNMPMIYIIEDNGVYGLTKGQFSATADLGSKLKTGVSTICRPSIAAPWRSNGAPPSWRAPSAATRSSCRPSSRPPSRTAASP